MLGFLRMITKKENLIQYFKSGIKDIQKFKIGIEHEKFIFDLDTNKRIDYQKILKMFEGLYEFGWKPIIEDSNIVGLKKFGKSITLEPGNQIELSGDKLNDIHEACAESQDYLFELKQVLQKLNLEIVSSGFDPISKLLEVPNNPKRRYQIMTRDMPSGGPLSLDMMYRTCGTQLNIDYSSEQDFIKKFKVINSIVPISIALFANSSIVEKKKSNYLSYRSKVWQNTSRGGLPEIFFDNMDFEKYSEFVMNFPILFIKKDKEFISGKNYLFSDFMNGNVSELKDKVPSEDDLATHLSTIFTENRLKKYIELRSMDACGWDCLCAGPAFNTGFLYGNLDEVYELVYKWDKKQIINAYLESPKKGFNTQLMGKDLFYWSSVLLELSKKGLENRDIIGKSGYNEANYLKHLEKIIDNRTTNADHMINKFSKGENLKELYDK
ncbi:glutamate-cysteine ligase family protein [Candidatus Pelagibacter sp.]|nr:glutamate-cysteine ligase family protein [Candidatus Pelagibacter sp.]